MPKIGLVLNGGGFAGAKQVGPPKELWRREQIPAVIQGVSVGAMNAAKLVESGPDELEKNWRQREKIGPQSIFNWRGAFFHAFSNHLLSDRGLNELVNQLDIYKILESPIKLQVIVRNESKQQLEVFTNHDPQFVDNPEKLRKIIKASTSLRGIFPPVEIDGQWYCDGYYFKLEELTDCDTIFLLLNDEQKVGSDFHLATWYKRFVVDFNEVLDDLNVERIDNFLETHPEFGEYKAESSLSWVQKTLKHWTEKVKKVLGSKQLVVISPSYSIPTLTLDSFTMPTKFMEGDVSKAIRLGTEQAKKLFDEMHL